MNQSKITTDAQFPTTPVDSVSHKNFEMLKQAVKDKEERQKQRGPYGNYLSRHVLNRITMRYAQDVVNDIKGLGPEVLSSKKGSLKRSLAYFNDISLYYAAQTIGAADKAPPSYKLESTEFSPTATRFLQILLTLMNSEERKILRYFHFFIADLNLQADVKNTLLNSLINDFQQRTNLVDKAMILRTIYRVNNSKQSNVLLRNLINDALKTHIHPNISSQKKNLVNLIKSLTDKDKHDKQFLIRTIFQIVKHNPDILDPKNIPYFIEAARYKDEDVAREALGTLALLADKNPNLLASLKQVIPVFIFDDKQHSNNKWSYSTPEKLKESKKDHLQSHLNVNDKMARYHLVKTVCNVIPNLKDEMESSTKKPTSYSISNRIPNEWASLFQSIKFLLHDEELVNFFEATKQIALRNFAIFLESDPKQNNMLLLEYVVNRLNNSMKKLLQIQVHAASRVAYYLTCSFQTFRSYFPNQCSTPQIANTMDKLYGRLEFLVSFDCSNVRLQTFKGLLWSDGAYLEEQVLDRLKTEIRSNDAWMPFHIHELLLCLLDYSLVNSGIFKYFVELCSFVCIQCSDRIDVDLMIVLFQRLLAVCREKGLTQQFLWMIFYILDQCLNGSVEAVDLSFSIHSYLGEYANRLCDEPNQDKQPLDQTVLNPYGKLSPQELLQRAELFDVQNGAIKAIILRLYKSAMYNTPQIREVAVEGLGKIAFRSLDPVRLFVYQCLSHLSRNDVFGVATQAGNLIQVLDEVYGLLQTYLKLKTKDQTIEDLANFFELHEQVKEKIGFYCRFPPSFMPLGVESREVLTKAFNARRQRFEEEAMRQQQRPVVMSQSQQDLLVFSPQPKATILPPVPKIK